MSATNLDHHITIARTAFSHGDYEKAYSASSSSLAFAPTLLEARVLRVNCALQLKRWQAAIADLQILLRAMPENDQFQRLFALCWLRIGNTHRDANELTQAARAYETALQAYPKGQDARYNLALLLLKSDHRQRAIEMLFEVHAAEPENALAALNLAQGLTENERGAEALPILKNLISRNQEQETLERAATLLAVAGDTHAALSLGLRIYPHQPQRFAQALGLAASLRHQGNLTQANTLLDELAPTASATQQLQISLARHLGLPALYESANDVEQARGNYAAQLNEFTQTYSPARIAEIQPDPAVFIWENFYLAYQGRDDRLLQEIYGRWLNAALTTLLPEFSNPAPSPSRKRPRLLMVSSFFRQCTVGAYFFSWVHYLAQHGFEVILVQIGKYDDELTRQFARAANKLLRIDGPLAQIARRLRELDADVLLYPEIGMEARVLALAALRLAPIQLCAWGHPVTTGLPSIDAFLSCAEMEPHDAQQHYSEPLLTLPGLGTRYLSPPLPAIPTRADLGLPDQRKLYLFPQSPFKLHPDNDALLIELIRRDPTALIVLFDGQTVGMTRLLRARLLKALGAISDTPEEHLHFFPQRSRSDYLRVNLVCDVMLDSLHWSGGNTTLDALHCALPVVTCPGQLMRGRQSMAMLRHLGLEELIVPSATALAETAVAIAHDVPRRARLSASIRDRLPELTASQTPLKALSEHLHHLLKTHRERKPCV